MRIIKVGVIGCGEIAQWMHLPFLMDLPGFHVTAVCDISRQVAAHAGERFGVERRFTDFREMLEHADLDAVVIATPIHSDPAIAAAQAGKHVLVEKPMAFNLGEAEAMADAAEQARVTLMVAYMKRYDPGYQYGQALMRDMRDVHLIRAHDLCGPNSAFLRDVTTSFRDELLEEQTRAALMADIRHRSEAAIGIGHPEAIYRAYSLLGSLASHDISILRGAFGSPSAVTHTAVWNDGRYILSSLDYGAGCRCVFEIGQTSKKEFDEELAAYGEHKTVHIRFPSPFVKYAPTLVHATEQDGTALVQRTVTTSYEESFRRELEHFYTCVVDDRVPDTSGRDGVEDMRLQIDIMKRALAS